MKAMTAPIVSVVICSHNGGHRIGATLAGLARQTEAPAWELLVIDNASTDGLAETCRSLWPTDASGLLRVVPEPRKGQVHARNTGLAAASGSVILFTDDDVHLPQDWVARMSAPLLEGRADAVVGRIVLPASRRPAWMTGDWPAFFSSTEHYRDPPDELVGACMGFRREVLAQVPAFDPMLGPGALGFFDDTLFALQLRAAGLSLRFLDDVRVEHHFALDRLSPAHLRAFASAHGRSQAYADYHWRHLDAATAWRHRLGWWRALAWIRFKTRLQGRANDVPGMREVHALRWLAYWSSLHGCRKLPRNYLRHGLRRLETTS